EEFKRVLLSDPHCILGKKGISEEFIQYIHQLLRKNKIIKIKALRSIANKSNINELAKIIVEKTNSYLLDVRGNIIIISKTLTDKKE
ncbi:MAG: YhbY family RNA-binding protein, partial [Promethearchaeota archaeon]